MGQAMAAPAVQQNIYIVKYQVSNHMYFSLPLLSQQKDQLSKSYIMCVIKELFCLSMVCQFHVLLVVTGFCLKFEV